MNIHEWVLKRASREQYSAAGWQNGEQGGIHTQPDHECASRILRCWRPSDAYEVKHVNQQENESMIRRRRLYPSSHHRTRLIFIRTSRWHPKAHLLQSSLTGRWTSGRKSASSAEPSERSRTSKSVLRCWACSIRLLRCCRHWSGCWERLESSRRWRSVRRRPAEEWGRTRRRTSCCRIALKLGA